MAKKKQWASDDVEREREREQAIWRSWTKWKNKGRCDMPPSCFLST